MGLLLIQLQGSGVVIMKFQAMFIQKNVQIEPDYAIVSVLFNSIVHADCGI